MYGGVCGCRCGRWEVGGGGRCEVEGVRWKV